MTKAVPNYRTGTIYSLVTIALLATQHPFSLPAAERLSVIDFVLATQAILLASAPVLLRTAAARRDFRSLLATASNFKYFFVLLAIGLVSHVLYFIALNKGHPITIAAVLNLSPFWAAIVALLVARKAVPTSYPVFFGCLAVAFVGAMLIAFSQMKDAPLSLETLGSLSPYWLFAVPVPLLFALSGTLIAKWFADRDEMACIAVTFVTASAVLIPIAAAVSFFRSDLAAFSDLKPDLWRLAVGAVLGAAVGLVVYQIALSVTDNDNGFVSMFFLIGPALTALLSLAMSPWLAELKFAVDPLFFCGLFLVAVPIFLFSWQARRRAESNDGEPAGRASENEPELANP